MSWTPATPKSDELTLFTLISGAFFVLVAGMAYEWKNRLLMYVYLSVAVALVLVQWHELGGVRLLGSSLVGILHVWSIQVVLGKFLSVYDGEVSTQVLLVVAGMGLLFLSPEAPQQSSTGADFLMGYTVLGLSLITSALQDLGVLDELYPYPITSAAVLSYVAYTRLPSKRGNPAPPLPWVAGAFLVLGVVQLVNGFVSVVGTRYQVLFRQCVWVVWSICGLGGMRSHPSSQT